jgi:hypothetical protein
MGLAIGTYESQEDISDQSLFGRVEAQAVFNLNQKHFVQANNHLDITKDGVAKLLLDEIALLAVLQGRQEILLVKKKSNLE